MTRRFLRAAAILLPLIAAAGCTADPAPHSTATTPVPVPSMSSIASAARLTCGDGTSGINPPDAAMRRFNGLAADGWLDRVLPLPSRPAGADASFWKAFLYATSDARRWTTVTIASPATARLYYVPFSAWTGQTPDARLDTGHLTSGRTAVEFEFCGEEPLGYTGGVLTQEPACVTLTVSAEGRPDATVRLPLGVAC
jgi:hypothetical protein